MDSSLFQKASALLKNVNKVIIEKENVVSLSCATLLAGGHLLIEDIPGVGKTILALAIARSIGGKFQRIQFTADPHRRCANPRSKPPPIIIPTRKSKIFLITLHLYYTLKKLFS